MAESSYAATELTGVYARQLERQPVAECCGGHDDACARAFASCVEMAVAVFAVIHTGMGTVMRRLLPRTEAQTPAAFLATDCWSPGLIIPQTYGALAGGSHIPWHVRGIQFHVNSDAGLVRGPALGAWST